MSRLKVGVLVSGRGSNMEALAEACGADDHPAEISVVVSNRPHAAGLERAASFGIATEVVDHTAFADKPAFEAEVIRVLEEHGVELICLAGFMRVLSEDFVARFPHKILNIHPSLLPAFPGLHVQRKAIEYGVRFSGCTVHFVVPEVDAGPIVLQAVVPIEQDDTEGTLAARILEQEHRIYAEAVQLFAQDRLRTDDRRVLIAGEGEGWRPTEGREPGVEESNE
jgi:phosphoribosylglycinamide formyltransferase-1